VGGIEIHTYEVARRLAAAGHQVTILTTDLVGDLPAEEQLGQLRIRRVRAWPRHRDYYFAPGIYRAIRQSQADWDLIHLQGYNTFVAPMAMLAARRSGLPYVVTFHSGGHSSWLRNSLRPLQHILLRPLLARAERLIGVSPWEARFFGQRLRLPQERITIIANGAYLGDREQVTSDRELATPDPAPAIAPSLQQPANASSLIVSVGRLERYKGHHRLVMAMPRILAERPDVRLRIVGSGPYEAAIRAKAQECGVADRVEIRPVPGSDRAEMARVLLGAELVILLSAYESQGIAVLEALALGRPVLVADTTALRDLATSGLARATPLGSDADEVAKAVLQQLRQPLVPASVDLPTWDDSANALLGVYQSVIERRCAS
jgi:glycosyltransferase involved in cell wall biosynthesis